MLKSCDILCPVMNENIDPIYEYIDKRIDERIAHEQNLLDYKITAIQRVLVEIRARFLNEQILSHDIIKELDETKNILYSRKYKRIVSSMTSALSTLQGKLNEEAPPEDVYKEWIVDVRTILSGDFTPQQVELLLFQSSIWEKMMGISQNS